MAIFKRVELWLLLALTAAGTWYVLQQAPVDPHGDPATPAPDSSDPSAPPEAAPSGKLRQVILSREEDGYVIEVNALLRNDADAPATISAATTPLHLADGSSVPAFFTPFDAAPVSMEPGEESLVSLRYWANIEALQGTLNLQLPNGLLPIKDEQPFSPDRLEAHASLTFASPTWESGSPAPSEPQAESIP